MSVLLLRDKFIVRGQVYAMVLLMILKSVLIRHKLNACMLNCDLRSQIFLFECYGCGLGRQNPISEQLTFQDTQEVYG